MSIPTLIYYTIATILNAVVLMLYFVEYRRATPAAFRRWFILFAVNAVSTGCSLLTAILGRIGAYGTLMQFTEELRKLFVLLNIVAVPFFIHAFLPKTQDRIGNIVAALLFIMAIALEKSGLWVVSGILMVTAIVYGVVSGCVYAFHHRYRELPDRKQLRFALTVSLIVVPGIIMDTIHGYGIAAIPIWNKLNIDTMTIYFLIAAPFLLAAFRRRIPAGAPTEPQIFSELSDREQEVVDCIMKGNSNREIAELLCIAESTVKKHIHSIFRKLGVSSRWQLLNLRKSSW